MSEHEKRPDEEAADVERADTIEDLDVPEHQQGDLAGGTIKQTVVPDDVGDDRP